MLLQDLHDSHLCNKLLVAESEEDIWKSESHYKQRLNTSDGESESFLCFFRYKNLFKSSVMSHCNVFAAAFVNIHIFLTTKITAQRRATRPAATWLLPCSSSQGTLPATWCGAPSSTFIPASRWGPTWACPGVSGSSLRLVLRMHCHFSSVLFM